MKTRLIFILGCILLLTQHTSCQQLNNILKDIKVINEVHCEGVGIDGEKTSQYDNYEKLLKVAKVTELIELVDDSNAAVNCYATWALIERQYDGVAAIFSRFLNRDKELTSFCGCKKYTSSLSEEVYFRYRSNEGHDDKLRNTIDSLVLYNANSSKLLIQFALKSRTYPVTYNSRLEHLAFKQLNRDAILYLKKVYAKKYQPQIKSALLSYLQRTDFSKTGTTDYFDVVSELLKYEDQTVNKAIITKLKSDAWWKHDYGKFYGLFGEYNLEKTLPAY